MEAKRIVISRTAQTRGTTATNIDEFHENVAVPYYVDAVVSNINIRFSSEVVKILTLHVSSIFNPVLLLHSETWLPV